MESFIDLVRKAPCIWDISCRSYKEQGKQSNASNNIASFFDKDGMYQVPTSSNPAQFYLVQYD